jgi:hypothetical protein
MIVLLNVILFGFAHFSIRRGADKPLVLMGLVAYAVSAGAHVTAATVNGFIVPALAARRLPHDFFALARDTNQAFAALGVYATSAAFAFWAAHLLLSGKPLDRALAFVGITCGAFAAVGLASGAVKLDVAGAFKIYGAHAIFSFLVGWRMAAGGFNLKQTAAP